MMRQWHTPPPPIVHRTRGVSLLDWVMPWILMAITAAVFIYTAPLWMPHTPQNLSPTVSDSVPVTGHPLLDRMWRERRRAGEHILPAQDYDFPIQDY